MPGKIKSVVTEADYSPPHLIALFNEMAKTYGAVNLLSSLGFSHLWRRACVERLELKSEHICADLMCGMGEATCLMLKKVGSKLQVDSFDFSSEMTQRFAQLYSQPNVTVKTQNVFDIPPLPRYDRICCSFGIKTLTDEDLQKFALLVRAILRPGGRAAFVEIHVPKNQLFRFVYLSYIRFVIPLIGRLTLGNPACYRNLSVYTLNFASRDHFGQYLSQAGFQVTVQPLFFGCARLYVAA